MRRLTMILAATAATAVVAVPAAAQQPYPYAYPQHGYAQQGYAYPQHQGGIAQIINQLLGNRYQTNDRLAVQRCASAAMVEAGRRYQRSPYGQAYGYPQHGYGYPQHGYGYSQQGYGYSQQGYGHPQQGYHSTAAMRVTAITDVRRQRSGLRVSGLIDSRGGGYAPYGNAYGYHHQAHAADLSFRCNVDYRGAVTNVRLAHYNAAYRRG